jgi:hypothetical protein
VNAASEDDSDAYIIDAMKKKEFPHHNCCRCLGLAVRWVVLSESGFSSSAASGSVPENLKEVIAEVTGVKINGGSGFTFLSRRAKCESRTGTPVQ